MSEIKGRIEANEVTDFMTIMSQILDEFVPEPGQETVIVEVMIHKEKNHEQTARTGR